MEYFAAVGHWLQKPANNGEYLMRVVHWFATTRGSGLTGEGLAKAFRTMVMRLMKMGVAWNLAVLGLNLYLGQSTLNLLLTLFTAMTFAAVVAIRHRRLSGDHQQGFFISVSLAFVAQTARMACVLRNGDTWLGYGILLGDLLFYSMLTAMPYWSFDELAEVQHLFGLGWRTYAFEIAIIVTFVLGFVTFSTPSTAAKSHHKQVIFYHIACTICLLGFGLLSGTVVGTYLEHSAGKDFKEIPLPDPDEMELVNRMVLALDGCTILPAVLLTCCTGAYKHNLGLDFNVVCTAALLIYVVYSGMVAHAREAGGLAAAAREGEGEGMPYIRIA